MGELLGEPRGLSPRDVDCGFLPVRLFIRGDKPPRLALIFPDFTATESSAGGVPARLLIICGV